MLADRRKQKQLVGNIMIISRAPLRISFVGGGTDLKSFYSHYPGRVISATINKYVYIVVKPDLLDRFIIKYREIEETKHPREIKHGRFREALLQANIVDKGLEIASFADLLARTGLGSSSSFSVALIKALEAYKGRSITKQAVAEAAAYLEIELLGEPIGKQDQYAAAFGGFNVFQFNADGSVDVEPLFLDFTTIGKLQDHMVVYFTGITRDASSILGKQSQSIADKIDMYKAMSDSVYEFRSLLLKGDVHGLAALLHEGWVRKKSLASGISNSFIDVLYEAGIAAGAWGGKMLGAGGGGCLLFFAPPETHANIISALDALTTQEELLEARHVAVEFSQSGADILFNSL